MMKTSRQQLDELRKSLYVGTFAERETIQEAYDYAEKAIKAMPQCERALAYTLLHVMLNTVSKRLEDILRAPLTDETTTSAG